MDSRLSSPHGTRDSGGFLQLDRSVDSITVGARHRKDLGDLGVLARSIRDRGLLQPITITPDGALVCGLRRLEAIKQLGWRTTNVWVRRVSEGAQRLLAEQDENSVRKPYTDLEAEELYREIKALLAEEAARHQAATRFGTRSVASGGTCGRGVLDSGTPARPGRRLPQAGRATGDRHRVTHPDGAESMPPSSPSWSPSRTSWSPFEDDLAAPLTSAD